MKIEDFKNRNTLNIPEDYFVELHSKITSRTCNNNATTIPKRKKPFSWRSIGYAASIVAVSLIGEYAYNRPENSLEITANEEYYDKEYIDNILANYPIDDYTFYCYLTNTDTDQ